AHVPAGGGLVRSLEFLGHPARSGSCAGGGANGGYAAQGGQGGGGAWRPRRSSCATAATAIPATKPASSGPTRVSSALRLMPTRSIASSEGAGSAGCAPSNDGPLLPPPTPRSR